MQSFADLYLLLLFCYNEDNSFAGGTLLEIIYLLNSGFAVRFGRTLLVFDDYQDPANAVLRLLGEVDEVYFFVSHAHFDHFDTHILDYAPDVTQYFMASEIRRTKRGKRFPEEKTTYLTTYDSYEDGAIRVESFDSTDTGTSFLVEKEGRRIFHAGDFNWWHWKGDTEENNKFARNGFMKQMKRLDGLEADVAFFPVDGRLEEFKDIGAKEFCARTRVKALVTMHSVGFPAWQPSENFFAPGCAIPYWVPTEPGERRYLEDGGGFSE